MPWYEDAEVWAAIGSLGAVLISLVALYGSYRRQAEQKKREKREELRSTLERLVTLREEQNKLNKEQDERTRATAAVYQNAKRTIYLEAAESLARQIPHDLSASEYAVLALENWWESDFVESKAYYEMAVNLSQHTSAVRRAELMRSLASVCFFLQDIDKGRETYQSAIWTLEGRTDDYSLYGQYLTYKGWAVSEIRVKNLTRAADLLDYAGLEFSKIPSANGVVWINDLRDLVYQWVYLGAEYFKAREDDVTYVEKGRLAFGEAQKVTQMLSTKYGSNSGYTIDARGIVFHWWGQQESEAGFADEGQQLLVKAEREFQLLPDSFPWKEFRLAELRRAQSQIALGETPTQPPPQELSANADFHPAEESTRAL